VATNFTEAVASIASYVHVATLCKMSRLVSKVYSMVTNKALCYTFFIYNGLILLKDCSIQFL